MRYDELMNQARQANDSRDKIDGEAGCASPRDGDLSAYLYTAMEAIKCGINISDWSCIAEGQAMLEQLLLDIQSIELCFLKSIKTGIGGCSSRESSLYETWHEIIKDQVDWAYIRTLQEKHSSGDLPQMCAFFVQSEEGK